MVAPHDLLISVHISCFLERSSSQPDIGYDLKRLCHPWKDLCSLLCPVFEQAPSSSFSCFLHKIESTLRLFLKPHISLWAHGNETGIG